jgi:hypothetical protein
MVSFLPNKAHTSGFESPNIMGVDRQTNDNITGVEGWTDDFSMVFFVGIFLWYFSMVLFNGIF